MADAYLHAVSLGKFLQRIELLFVEQNGLVLIQKQHDSVLVNHRHTVGIYCPQGGHLTLVEQIAVVRLATAEHSDTEESAELSVQQFQTGTDHVDAVEAAFQQFDQEVFILHAGAGDEEVMLLHFYGADACQRCGKAQVIVGHAGIFGDTYCNIACHDILYADGAEDPLVVRMVLRVHHEGLLVFVDLALDVEPLQTFNLCFVQNNAGLHLFQAVFHLFHLGRGLNHVVAGVQNGDGVLQVFLRRLNDCLQSTGDRQHLVHPVDPVAEPCLAVQQVANNRVEIFGAGFTRQGDAERLAVDTELQCAGMLLRGQIEGLRTADSVSIF